jgi:hypothetical protein
MTDTLRKSREQASPAKYGIDMLYKHCEEANKLNWVIASGRPYFVNRRENSDGTFTHFVDRSA